MITVKLYQKVSKIGPDGKAPIYYRLYDGIEPKLIGTKKSIEPQYFDNESGIVLSGGNNAGKLNSYFRIQLTKIEDIIIDLQRDGTEPTMDRVKEIYTNNFVDDFIAFAYDELKKEKGLIADKTYTGYNDRINALKRYKTVIPFRAITLDFLNEYKYHVAVIEERDPNGYYQDFAVLRKYYKKALKAGKAKGYPFEDFDIDREETSRNWLEEDELAKLHKLLETDSLTYHETRLSHLERKKVGADKKITDAEKNTLRHFLFCCYTGIRFGDELRLGDHNVINNRLSIKTSKTGKNILMTFNSHAKALLDYVLSQPLKQSNDRVNTDLAACMKAAGISKDITFHCSRHTFAIHCILLGIDLITVRDWLGHKKVSTTEIYAKIAQQYKDENMKKWDKFGQKAA